MLVEENMSVRFVVDQEQPYGTTMNFFQARTYMEECYRKLKLSEEHLNDTAVLHMAVSINGTVVFHLSMMAVIRVSALWRKEHDDEMQAVLVAGDATKLLLMLIRYVGMDVGMASVDHHTGTGESARPVPCHNIG